MEFRLLREGENKSKSKVMAMGIRRAAFGLLLVGTMKAGCLSRITTSRLEIACDFYDRPSDLECIATNEKRLELVSMCMEDYLISGKVLLHVEK